MEFRAKVFSSQIRESALRLKSKESKLMNWERLTKLDMTVEATAANRPIKIAYLLPFDETATTHLRLDAVFFESYTRWAGLYTLVLPTTAQGFLLPEYEAWLQRFDPDFVYSYVDLEAAFVDMIDRLCCPIALLKHEMRERDDQPLDWRAFLPEWHHYFHPVSSITTLLSPASYLQHPHEERPREPTVLTQFEMQPRNRFLADNFGTGFSQNNVTNAITGFFRTLCLVPPSLPDNVQAGSERCHSALEAFAAITNRKATPISRLAMVHGTGVPRLQSLGWGSAFRLFVGSTALDRIHFWNCRHLASSWSDIPNAMIVDTSFFKDLEQVKQLGQYLNKNNFLGQGNGHYQVALHSYSVANDVLQACRDTLDPTTWNEVRVSKRFDAPAVPTSDDLKQRVHEKSTDTSTLKLTEDCSEVVATAPAHFAFLPPERRGYAYGQWIVDLTIQRHNNLSRFSNVIDTWTLPRRRRVARAFTKNLAKPTRHGRLAILPVSQEFPFRSRDFDSPSRYEIRLPSDSDFFRHLTLDFYKHPADDLRALVLQKGYRDLAISDKGQNLRGVISLFDDLSTAAGILTKRYWREVLKKAKVDSSRPRVFDWNLLESLLPRDVATKERLTKELRFENPQATHRYLRDSLWDTLEHLVRSRVFYLVARWRCAYCGHANSRNFDNMRLKNECEICSTEFLPDIDMKWEYELSAFVHQSLHDHSGLPVLWALSELQHGIHTGSFWYMPEVNLFESDDELASKNEIDILCVRDGAFCAVEVKRTASSFLNDPETVEKFVKVVGLLCPDVAQLAFEQYCSEASEVAETKARLATVAKEIRARIEPWTVLEVVVAEDRHDFREFAANLGWFGPRTRRNSLRGNG